MNDAPEQDLAGRLKALRLARGLTLDALAAGSGVSRAMISRVERGEASPTAALLGRLCATLGVSMSGFFAPEEGAGSPLSRASGQTVWRDPATGYVRRNVSPRLPGSTLEIVEVLFPAGERVRFDNPWSTRPTEQVVWLLDGALEMTVGDEVTRLEAGDSLHMRLDRPIGYFNPGPRPARYAVILSAPA
ncbi:MAG: helix-turn-helix domain-containing protein [Alsobacter sp.]